MPKRITPLSDVEIKKAKPQEKPHKLFDGGGLYLLVTPTGGKLWNLKYNFSGKEKKLSFGAYPAVSLADARQRRDDAKKLLANGQDPGAIKKALQDAAIVEAAVEINTFEKVALEWYAKNKKVWVESHSVSIKGRLNTYILPAFGNKPITEITPVDIRSMLLDIEARGLRETGKRVKVIVGQICRYAIALGYAQYDPSGSLKLSELYAKVTDERHHAALVKPKEVAELLRAIDSFQGSFVVKTGLSLAPMLFVRPGELRQMEWSEVDLDEGLWSLPAGKMKTRNEHLVPLSQQAMELLQAIKPLTGSGRYVFPNLRSPLRPMSEVALLAALRRIGYSKEEMTVHGFRAIARTILDEVLGFRVDIIEHQLAHAVRDANGRAYNRTSFLDDRRKMMQQWSDYLDGLKAGAKVLPLRRACNE